MKENKETRYEVKFIASLTDDEVSAIEGYLWQTLYEQLGISAEFIETNIIEENY